MWSLARVYCKAPRAARSNRARFFPRTLLGFGVSTPRPPYPGGLFQHPLPKPVTAAAKHLLRCGVRVLVGCDYVQQHQTTWQMPARRTAVSGICRDWRSGLLGAFLGPAAPNQLADDCRGDCCVAPVTAATNHAAGGQVCSGRLRPTHLLPSQQHQTTWQKTAVAAGGRGLFGTYTPVTAARNHLHQTTLQLTARRTAVSGLCRRWTWSRVVWGLLGLEPAHTKKRGDIGHRPKLNAK